MKLLIQYQLGFPRPQARYIKYPYHSDMMNIQHSYGGDCYSTRFFLVFPLPNRVSYGRGLTVVVIDRIIIYISALKTKDSNTTLANSVFWL